MKHIHKKYLHQEELTKQGNRLFERAEEVIRLDIDNLDLKKYSKTHNVLLETEGATIMAFIYNNQGKHIHIPLPDFTLVYYDFAYRLNIQRIELQTNLLTKLTGITTFKEDSSEEVYSYYGVSSALIICLFTSIESFINLIIPNNYRFVDNQNRKRTEIYNKDQIQEFMTFNDKVTKVLPDCLGKGFFKTSTTANQHIWQLKSLRDDIVHTKTDEKNVKPIDLFKRILKFNYLGTFEAVRTFMNFYKPDYNVDCPCD